MVLEVTDELLPENAGRWRLVGGPSAPTCAATTEPAELACDVRALGELYLGGTALGGARRRRPGPGTACPGRSPRAGPAFGWHRAPAPMEVF